MNYAKSSMVNLIFKRTRNFTELYSYFLCYCQIHRSFATFLLMMCTLMFLNTTSLHFLQQNARKFKKQPIKINLKQLFGCFEIKVHSSWSKNLNWGRKKKQLNLILKIFIYFLEIIKKCINQMNYMRKKRKPSTTDTIGHIFNIPS